MSYVEFEGRRIAYEVQPESFDANDLAVVFIHGSGGDRNDWRFQLDGLSDTCTVIALELPGHGLSDQPGESDVSKYALRVEGFIEKLGLTKVVVVGCSLGSAITQTMALNPKPWLKAIGLVGAGARLRVMPSLLEALLSMPDKALDNLADYCLSDSASDQLRTAMKLKYTSSDPLLIHGDLSACDKFDVMKQLSLIKLPTIIIVGAQDKLTPVKYSKFLNESIGASTMTVIDNAGHLVMLEQPEHFNMQIRRFLGQIS